MLLISYHKWQTILNQCILNEHLGQKLYNYILSSFKMFLAVQLCCLSQRQSYINQLFGSHLWSCVWMMFGFQTHDNGRDNIERWLLTMATTLRAKTCSPLCKYHPTAFKVLCNTNKAWGVHKNKQREKIQNQKGKKTIYLSINNLLYPLLLFSRESLCILTLK